MSLKNLQFKKGIGIENQNLCKQFNDQKTTETRWSSILYDCYRRKVHSKAFASYPYSDCICLYNIAVRIGIENALELTVLL